MNNPHTPVKLVPIKVGFTETPENQEIVHNNYDEYTYLIRNISTLRVLGAEKSNEEEVRMQQYETMFLAKFKEPYESYLAKYYNNDNYQASKSVQVKGGNTTVNPSRVYTAARFEQGNMFKLPQGAIPDIRPNIKNYTPDRMTLLMEMVDINLQPRAIGLDNGMQVSAVKLFPNPDSLTVNSSKKISRYNTMTRWVEEFWGDEMDNMSMSGSTYAFFQDAGSGLVLDSRRETAAHILLSELLKFYRLNGCLYYNNKDWYQDINSDIPNASVNDAVNSISRSATAKFLRDPDNARFRLNYPLAGMVKERLYIRIKFDFLELLGYFESFDISEEASSPYRFTYSASFKVEKTKYSVGAN